MCSINEVEEVTGIKKSKKGSRRREKNVKSLADEGSCMKCFEKAVVFVRNNDPFCRSCFLDYVVHKFRATIGKARVIHQGEKVLLAVSGGSASCAMLDLVIRGLSKTAVKKHRFQPGVVHIDGEGLCGQSVEDRHNVKHHIEELANSVGFPCYFVSLADLFISKHDGKNALETLQELDTVNEIGKSKNRLMVAFEKITTITAKEDLFLHLCRSQLQKVAKDHGYDYIMVGDCSTNLAVRILADVTQGRGSQLPFTIGFKDDRFGVPVLRPMREFTKKEIQYYNHFNEINSFTIPSFATKTSSQGSINRLTENLIVGLQASFPSTISTVLKTGDKLSSNVGSKDGRYCVLCLAPLSISSGFLDVANVVKVYCGTTCGGVGFHSDAGTCSGTSRIGVDQKSGRSSIGGGNSCRKHVDDSGVSHDKKSNIGGNSGCQKGCAVNGTYPGNDVDINSKLMSATYAGGIDSDFQSDSVCAGNNDSSISSSQNNDHSIDGKHIVYVQDGDGSHQICTENDISDIENFHKNDVQDDISCRGGNGLISTQSNNTGNGCQKINGNSTFSGTTSSDESSSNGNTVVFDRTRMDQASSGSQNTNEELLFSSLCYGCKLTYRDMSGSRDWLPDFITNTTRRLMKDEIKAFLLD